jgi:Ca2+-binding RTX toxin-like protein
VLPSRRLRAVVACGTAALALGLVSGSSGVTYARFSDTHAVQVTGQAGVWAPDPPAECGDLKAYAGVVWGTMGDDVLRGGNRPQVLMGLGGNDEIHGGNSGDCLVGGPGNDRLIGDSSKDILLGGDGDDHLDGGNAKDHLDGGADTDTCLGGNGKDTVVNCESSGSLGLPAPAPLAVTEGSPSSMGVKSGAGASGSSDGASGEPAAEDAPAAPASSPAPSAPAPSAPAPSAPAPSAPTPESPAAVADPGATTTDAAPAP